MGLPFGLRFLLHIVLVLVELTHASVVRLEAARHFYSDVGMDTQCVSHRLADWTIVFTQKKLHVSRLKAESRKSFETSVFNIHNELLMWSIGQRISK